MYGIKTKNKLGSGFTLAEVLITLSIIGVIASMVIPSLVQDVQDAQLRTAWKKAYSDIDQTTKRLMLENAGSLKGTFSDSNDMRDKYLKYLNYTKKCDAGTSYSNCWYDEFKQLNGVNQSHANFGNPTGGIINSGMLFINNLETSNCSTLYNSLKRCGWLWVDVNGFKGPNTIGKDIYGMQILEKGILPYGTDKDSWTNTCNTSNNGWGCAAKYLYQ